MKTLHLTPRLHTIASLIAKDARIADIGTDHAYLPVWLIQEDVVASAIASDIRKGPLHTAKNTAENWGVSNKISLRLGAGLETVQPFECDTVVIAGMGGETIATILEAALWTRQGNHVLLLQPMTMIQELRFFLSNRGYHIEQERLCREGKRLYTIIKARGTGMRPSIQTNYWKCCLSSALLADPLAGEYLQKMLLREEKALDGLLQGACPDELELFNKRKTVQYLRQTIEEAAL